MRSKFLLCLSALCFPVLANAQLPFDPSEYSDPSELISDDLTKSIVQSIGLAVDHRPYQSATPLNFGNKLGLDLGLEVTLVGIPDSLNEDLESAGLASADIPPSLPIPLLHVHKGIGERFDLGVTYIKYQIYRIIGGDVSIALHVPEKEGFIWAWRINYSTSTIGFLETRTWSTQVLISRPFAYFDTYLGIGYQNAWGKVTVTDTIPVINQEVTLSNEARVGAFMALVGVAMRLWKTGIKLTLEGSYNNKGSHYLGLKFGVQW